MAKANTRRGDSSVTLKCSNLEDAIREAINKPKDAISLKDIASLDSLKAYSVTDLTGLEYATNLTKLELLYSDFGDTCGDDEANLTPLAGLTKLTVLNLANSMFHNLTPLAGLTELSSLILRDVEIIYDITPLSGLTNLTKLNLCFNPSLTDITPLSGLTNLTDLNLHFNDITDITPLSGLTNLTNLDLCKNKNLADIAPLAELTKMIVMDLSYTSITDITPLSGMTNLTTLNLFLNNITDPTPLSELANLTTLNHQDFNAAVIDGDDPEDINNRFIEAAEAGDADIVRDLIAKEADLRSTNENGITAWELADDAGHTAVVKVLKEAAYDLEELLAHPEMGHSQRVPCPICGVFYNITEPTCSHFIGTTYGEEIQSHDLCDGLDGIVLTIAVDVEQYIDQSANHPPIKSGQKGKRKKLSRKEASKQLMESIPKSLVPAIDNMVNYGDQWWTHASGVKRGVSVTVDEFMNSSIHQDFFHRDVPHFVRIQKDRASKVMRWLEKQGYVPDESDSEL